MQTSRRRKVDIGVLTGGTLAVGAVAFGAAFVAGKQEEVGRYWTSAVVADDGSAQVTEVIDYDFGLNQKHGVFRWVPGLDSTSPITVSSPDAPDQIEISEISDTRNDGTTTTGTNIRIGDPNQTVTGEHRYRIDYALPGVRIGQTVDWEPVGTGWPVGMRDVEVHLITPFELESPLCVFGPAGSQETCDVREVEPGHVVATVDDLDAHEGVSLEGAQGAALAATPAAPDPPSGRPDDDATSPLAPAGAAAGAMALAAVPATALGAPRRTRDRLLGWCGRRRLRRTAARRNRPVAQRPHRTLDPAAPTRARRDRGRRDARRGGRAGAADPRARHLGHGGPARGRRRAPGRRLRARADDDDRVRTAVGPEPRPRRDHPARGGPPRAQGGVAHPGCHRRRGRARRQRGQPG